MPLVAACLPMLPVAAMAKGMPQLDFSTPLTTSQVVWGALIFIVLYIMLSRTGLPMVASVLSLFDDPAMADRLCPMKRPGTAEEMAYGCLYFASDESTYCQGSVLVIDGGTTARQ